MSARSQWGINRKHGWFISEEEQIRASRTEKSFVPDNVQQTQVVLVDRHGRPLVTRERRGFGFRAP